MRNRDLHETTARAAKLSRAVRERRPLGLLLIALLGGCSVYYETKRPDFTNVSTIEQGTPRAMMSRP